MHIGNISIEFDAPKSSTKGISIRQDNYGKYQTSRMLFRFYLGKTSWDNRPIGCMIIGGLADCTGEQKATKVYDFNLPYRGWKYRDHFIGRLIHRAESKIYQRIDTRYT